MPLVSRPRFERQQEGKRVRVRDVRRVFRIEAGRDYVAHMVRPYDGAPQTERNFSYMLRGVDAGIADVLRILNTHGYPTMASMSGLLRDYPDTKEGAEFGYILFFKIDPKLERRILRAARSCGMGAEPRKRGGWMRGVRVDTGVTKSGVVLDHFELHQTAMREAKLRLGKNADRDKLLDLYEKLQAEIVRAHGGYVSDAGVKKLWSCFTERLTGETATVF